MALMLVLHFVNYSFCMLKEILLFSSTEKFVYSSAIAIVSLSHYVHCIVCIFTALHVMQTWYCDENSVRPSVCLSVRLSVTRVNCGKTVERSVQIYIPYERTFSLVF